MESPLPPIPRRPGPGSKNCPVSDNQPPEAGTPPGPFRPDGAKSGASAAAPWVLLARLVRPQGRRGEIIAEILTDFPERFHERRRLFLIPPPRIGTPARQILLENFWFLRSRLILKIQGIDSINEAESLRGYEVAVPAAERAPLEEEGSVYVSDLLGCHIFDLNRAGVDVGEVIDLDRGSSSTDLLVLRRPGVRGRQAEALIPFVRDYLVQIDTAARRIEMRLPEGLLDINAPLTDEEKREQHHRS